MQGKQENTRAIGRHSSRNGNLHNWNKPSFVVLSLFPDDFLINSTTNPTGRQMRQLFMPSIVLFMRYRGDREVPSGRYFRQRLRSSRSADVQSMSDTLKIQFAGVTTFSRGRNSPRCVIRCDPGTRARQPSLPTPVKPLLCLFVRRQRIEVTMGGQWLRWRVKKEQKRDRGWQPRKDRKRQIQKTRGKTGGFWRVSDVNPKALRVLGR